MYNTRPSERNGESADRVRTIKGVSVYICVCVRVRENECASERENEWIREKCEGDCSHSKIYRGTCLTVHCRKVYSAAPAQKKIIIIFTICIMCLTRFNICSYRNIKWYVYLFYTRSTMILREKKPFSEQIRDSDVSKKKHTYIITLYLYIIHNNNMPSAALHSSVYLPI